jgi:hypothetical protein
LARIPIALAFAATADALRAIGIVVIENGERIHVSQPEHGARRQQPLVAERATCGADREEHDLKQRRHLQCRNQLQRVGRSLRLMRRLQALSPRECQGNCDVTGTLDRVDRVMRFTHVDIQARLAVPAGTDPDQARAR